MTSHELVLLKDEFFQGGKICFLSESTLVNAIIDRNSMKGYDKTVNPTAASAFTTSAFRFFKLCKFSSFSHFQVRSLLASHTHREVVKDSQVSDCK